MASYDQPTHMGSTAVDWDAANKQRDEQQIAILSAAAKLDPELQSLVLQRLGIQMPQQRPQSFDGMSPTDALMVQQGRMQHPGAQPRIMGPQGRQLEAQKQLAQFKYQMGGEEREQKQQLSEAKLQALVERYQQLAQQGQMTQLLGQQRQALAEQTEGRRAQTASAPSMPPKQAQAIIESMAQQGAGPEQLAAAAQAMGYDIGSGQSYETGGLLGVGGTQVPVLGRRGVSGGAAALPKGKMRIRNTQTGQTAIGPEGAAPQGWERIN